MSQSVEPLIVRAGPGVVSVLIRERRPFNSRFLASLVVFGLTPSLSFVTPNLFHALLGSGLITCTPTNGDSRYRVGVGSIGAETTPKPGESSILRCVRGVGKESGKVGVSVVCVVRGWSGDSGSSKCSRSPTIRN